MKKNEQMFAMLSMAVSLFPQRIDDQVHSNLRDKYGDRMLKMQRGDNETFEELFAYCCPKFVSPNIPPMDPSNPLNLATVCTVGTEDMKDIIHSCTDCLFVVCICMFVCISDGLVRHMRVGVSPGGNMTFAHGYIYVICSCIGVQEAQQKQLKFFMSEVDQQVLLPTVRSYLKLYTTMPIRFV